MTIANESGGKPLDIMRIVTLCHEIQESAKRRETKSAGTVMCGEIAAKILRELERAAIPQEDGAREGVARWTTETEWSHEGQCDVTKVLEDPHGEFVKHEDHLAEAARLESERDAAIGRYADAVRECDALKSEVRDQLEFIQKTGHVEARLKAECAGLRALLSVARDSVEFEVQEKRQNWGDRLMHKQQGAIDLLAKITALLTPTPAAERGGEV
jgi:hypothetical protein